MAKKKRMSVFWKVYFVAFALILAAIGVWLYVLHGWLGDFEAAQPKYLVEEVFNENFGDFDANEYIKKCNTDSFLETDENIAAYLNELTAKKELTYKKVSAGLDTGSKYVVLCDDVKIASFMLTAKGEANGLLTQYEATNFEIFMSADTNVSVEVPKGYSVYLNGEKLSEKFIVENDIPTPSCEHMPEGVSGLYYTKYTAGGLINEPTVTVKASAGEECTVEKTDGVYKAQPIFDEALKAEYSEWVLEGSELYARYTQYDSNVNVTGFNKVAPYFDPDSELYESIRTMDNMFVQYYDSFEFTDMTADEFYRLDENTFSCRVQYTQKLYKGKDLYDDFVDQTLYLHLVDGEYLIYSMYVN